MIGVNSMPTDLIAIQPSAPLLSDSGEGREIEFTPKLGSGEFTPRFGSGLGYSTSFAPSPSSPSSSSVSINISEPVGVSNN